VTEDLGDCSSAATDPMELDLSGIKPLNENDSAGLMCMYI